MENIVMIIIKHLEMKKISVFDNPWRDHMPLDKYRKPTKPKNLVLEF